MSAPVPPGWSEPDEAGVIRRASMGMRASVFRWVDGVTWRWRVETITSPMSHRTPRGKGLMRTRYQAAEVASAVMAAIGAQR